MRLSDLTGQRVVLLGLGIDVAAALDEIRAAGPASITVVDDRPVPAELGGGPTVALGEAAADADVFVRSPGFPRYQPPLAAALERGARMTTPVDLWFGERDPARPVVAVTGTKGKSTTTHLIAHLAEQVGLRVGLAGNLGVPVFSADWEHDAAVIAIEVSSYQAADLHHVPDIAVLTSLAEDHLDWHGGYPQYVSDKLRVASNDGAVAPTILVPATEAEAVEATRHLGAILVDVPEAPAGVPRHRFQNAVLAAAAVEHLGGERPSDEAVASASLRSMPGRLDGRELRGILWVDDALASNPSATAAGLAWARSLGRPTVLVLGGADRGVDPTPLTDEVAQWLPGRLQAIALPDTGRALAQRCGLDLAAEAADVTEAVARAEALAGPGGVVLFSPAAPTPAGTGNWSTRSAAFNQAVDRA